MAHTIESLSKLLKKSSEDVISILAVAGIEGKTKDSEISGEERKVLMLNLSKRSSSKNNNATKKLEETEISSSNNGIKIKVKKSIKTKISNENLDDKKLKEESIKVKKALESGNLKEEILQEQEAKRKIFIEKQKEEEEKYKAIKEQPLNEPKENKQTTKENKTDKEKLKNKKTYKTYVINSNRKLKKKDRTRLSQKTQEEQAQHAFHKPVEKIIHEVIIPESIKISELASNMKTKVGEVLKIMMSMGVMATINDFIDQDTAILVVEEMGHKAIASKETTVEDTLIKKNQNSDNAVTRSPVVTFMGHVDHGKTSLLDYIRKTKTAAVETGGITQHISAYQAKFDNKNITFIDTPGHAAFSKMRSRGADVTDIVVLVVAGDDGVMPQTIESIKQAKKSNAEIIVAINKIDKEGVQIDKIKQVLSTHDVISEEWGGNVIIIGVSAHTGEGVDKLLEIINLTAEVLELKADKDIPASGAVLEVRLEKGRGKVTTILIQSGTLKKGDIVIAGAEYGKIKQIINCSGKPIQTAGASEPVEILGLYGTPESGDEILVVENEKKAKEVAEFRKNKYREAKAKKQQLTKMDNFLSKMKQDDIATLNILLKSDAYGSAQAIVEALEELSTEEVKTKVIHSGIGAINNTDINLAKTSNTIVLGFNVRADAVARKTAETENVKIEYYSIIYNLIDDVRNSMSGMLKPEFNDKIIGIALVKDIFKSIKFGDIAGCIVNEGVVRKDCSIRVLRDNVVIYEGELESLKRFKEDVKKVESGVECGIGILGYKEVQVGDQIEAFERIESIRKI